MLFENVFLVMVLEFFLWNIYIYIKPEQKEQSFSYINYSLSLNLNTRKKKQTALLIEEQHKKPNEIRT